MKALSIRQPWASLIIQGAGGIYKDIENRSWPTRFRGTFYVHASQIFDHAGYRWIHQQLPLVPLPPPSAFEQGGVIGIVELADCVDFHPSIWFQGPYGFLLRNPQARPFISLKGQRGFFPVTLESL